MIVVDASVIVEMLDAEVAHVVRRYALAGDIDAERGADMVGILSDLGIHRHDHRPLLARVWELPHAVGAYDALYVALAEALDAPLLTADQRLAAAHGHRADVQAI